MERTEYPSMLVRVHRERRNALGCARNMQTHGRNSIY
jgi:hypothetical protein